MISPIDESGGTECYEPPVKKRVDILQNIKNMCKEVYSPSAMKSNLLRKYMIGLKNMDKTTCYINAALQCLASTAPLVHWLFSQSDQLKTCK